MRYILRARFLYFLTMMMLRSWGELVEGMERVEGGSCLLSGSSSEEEF